MWYLSSWRDLRRRSNAGHGLGNKPEITPPSHSYHRPDGTAERVSKKCCPELTREPLSEIFCAVSFELETEAAKMRVVGFSDYSP
jgi:hypothetical protein